ncbi:MAG: hypothetical protein AAGA70_07920 [Pseudomonadota bacterium]
MSIRFTLAAAAAIAVFGAAAQAGPTVTGNASGGAITIVTPTPLLTDAAAPAAPAAPTAQAPAAAPAPAPVPASSFISGYVARFN